MARPWRVQYEGALYHVMSRRCRGEIFCTSEDYQRFLACLEMASEKFQLEIFAFVLMGNHYHVFLRTKNVIGWKIFLNSKQKAPISFYRYWGFHVVIITIS